LNDEQIRQLTSQLERDVNMPHRDAFLEILHGKTMRKVDSEIKRADAFCAPTVILRSVFLSCV